MSDTEKNTIYSILTDLDSQRMTVGEAFDKIQILFVENKED